METVMDPARHHIGRPQGMRAFTIVWVGQVVSLLGTTMAEFALMIWAWQATGRATTLSILAFFEFAPMIVLMPLAGVLVDRWDRKLTMALSDIASCLATVAVLVLYASGRLQVWHLYVTSALSAAFQAFQWPAYSAAITTMMPKEHYARASGMISLAQSGAGVLAPAIAGTLIATTGLPLILTIDIVTCIVAVATLAVVDVPRPVASADGLAAKGALRHQLTIGIRYIMARPPLFWLQMLFIVCNLFAMLCHGVWSAMILARSAGASTVLGFAKSASAVGFGLGGLLLTFWHGPPRKVDAVLWAMLATATVGGVLVGLGRSLPVWALAGFCGSFALPVMNGFSQTIWQRKVPADLQGRVFSARMQLQQVVTPLAMIAAGTLADHVFEPAMAAGGGMARVFGPLVGTGRGAGMAAMFVVFGTLQTIAATAGFFIRPIRHVDELLPDALRNDSSPAAVPTLQEA
jgi:DHA3 family macrolide efflux protein-like MFS transporter